MRIVEKRKVGMAAIDANAIAPHAEASAARRTRFRMWCNGIRIDGGHAHFPLFHYTQEALLFDIAESPFLGYIVGSFAVLVACATTMALQPATNFRSRRKAESIQ